ncbi:hypothetical protein [Streptomyces lavendulae]|uniref:hypothetical protein n=1 Tax=Streptomyces lavendulae TaxID=1914 RepID=UPI0024A601EF|nr:hypothetical protein [Streptomyces lavendulae]GLW00010.1 hypothetical protein Slala05_36410 [Streptomyces lavendulae subsp. lavendulae]
MSDPLHRTFLLVDTERFSDRDDVQQAYLRRMLYDVVDRTLLAAGVDQTLRLRADRGDAIMELIDSSVPVNTLLRALLTEVPAQLRSVNRLAASSAQIRLRAVLATGYVMIDEYDGWVGSDLNHACRLLDGDTLRAALRERHDDYALCVSEAVYSGIVRHEHPGVPSAEFREITVPGKNGPLTAWLHGPLPQGAAAAPAAATPSAAPSPASVSSPTSSPAPESVPTTMEVHFGGTNNGVQAGVVHGGITFGERR